MLINEYEKSAKAKTPAKPAKLTAKKGSQSNKRRRTERDADDDDEADEIVLGVTEVNDELVYLIQRKGEDTAQTVPSTEANTKYSDIVIDFLESKIVLTSRK